MSQERRNMILVAGIVAGFVSLPLPWFRVSIANRGIDPVFDGFEGDLYGSTFDPLGAMFDRFPGIMIPIDGLSGSLKLPVAIPIWAIVGLAIGAALLQLVRASSTFDIAPAVLWIPPLIAALSMAIPIVIVFFDGAAEIGIGWALGLLSAIAPLYCLFVSDAVED